mmetsp:Transcript_8855/g.22717  ORF Transcript_8855/g.22717 Transcript_8855/m.22717 type:complete len:234 (+) Transcript_8855:150-851(+)
MYIATTPRGTTPFAYDATGLHPRTFTTRSDSSCQAKQRTRGRVCQLALPPGAGRLFSSAGWCPTRRRQRTAPTRASRRRQSRPRRCVARSRRHSRTAGRAGRRRSRQPHAEAPQVPRCPSASCPCVGIPSATAAPRLSSAPCCQRLPVAASGSAGVLPRLPPPRARGGYGMWPPPAALCAPRLARAPRELRRARRRPTHPSRARPTAVGPFRCRQLNPQTAGGWRPPRGCPSP